MTLQELQEQLREVCNSTASTATIGRTSHRRGFTFKKVILQLIWDGDDSKVWSQITQPAVEHDEEDHANYKMLVGEHFLPGHLVFADESHFNQLSLQCMMEGFLYPRSKVCLRMFQMQLPTHD